MKNNCKLLIIGTLFFVAFAWTSFTSSYLVRAWEWDMDKVNPVPMWIAQLISIPLLTLILALLIKLPTLVKRNVKQFMLFLFYIIAFLIIFLSVAPGCLTEDTYYTFHMAKNGWWGGWYSFLHPALTTALIQIVPWGFNAPGIFLALIWAAIYAGAHVVLKELKAPKVAHLALIPLVVMPAQLASSVIVIRDSFFTAFFILFLGYTFYLLAIQKKINPVNILCLSTIGSALMIYRSDAIPSVLISIFLIAAVFSGWKLKSFFRWEIMLTSVAPIALFFLFSSAAPLLLNTDWVRGNTWDPRAENEYKLTLIENPLGYIVKKNGIMSDDERKKIERVFKIDDLKGKSCPENLCLFYGGFWNKESSKEERDSAFSAALAVFARNTRLFLQSRLSTLSTVGDKNTQTVCTSSLMAERGFDRLSLSSGLTLVGDKLLGFIRNTESLEGVAGGKLIWWNVYIPASILFLITACFIWAPAAGLIAFILLVRTLVVFLAAPAGFTIYYLTIFVGTPFVLIFWLVEMRASRMLRSG